MHDIKFIRKNPKKFEKQMNRRGLKIDTSSILEIDEAIRKKQAEIQVIQEKRNKVLPSSAFVPPTLTHSLSFSFPLPFLLLYTSFFLPFLLIFLPFP